jgi:hypothetical protein
MKLEPRPFRNCEHGQCCNTYTTTAVLLVVLLQGQSTPARGDRLIMHPMPEMHLKIDHAAAKAARLDIQTQWETCNDMIQRAIVFNLDARVDRWIATKEHLLSVGICPARFSACSDKDVVELTFGECKERKDEPHFLHGTPRHCHTSDKVMNGSLYVLLPVQSALHIIPKFG